MFVGWDWASTTHDVTVVDDTGAVVDRWALRHTEQDLAAALDRLAHHGDPAALPVIIERTSGLVVDRLVAAGHPVVPVHPTAFWAARPRWGASGAKSTLVTATSWLTTAHRRAPAPPAGSVRPRPPGAPGPGAAARDHVRARTAASNQLGALLEAHWPGPKAVFYRLASPIALAFLADYPTPQAAAHLGEARMASFCRRHSYRGGKPPAVLLARLRSVPTAPVGIPPATLATLVHAQVQLLPTLLVTIAELEAKIAARVACHPRAKLLASLPGVGTINLAQLLAEVGPILDRVPSAEHAAAECGAAPATKASGKASGVYFRWAANRRARKALTAFTHNSRLASPWAGRLYADARARGKRNPHATRIVARAWLRVIWACWQHPTPYNPALHTAALRAAARPT
jgi:hypothetical protein